MNETSAVDAEHSKRRWKAVFYSGFASAGAKALALICQLIQVPIALHYLGAEAFGLWMTLTNTVALISFADLGLGLGIQYRVAEAYGRDDFRRVRTIFNTGLLLLMVVGGGLFLLTLPICYGIDWGGLFKIHEPLLRASTRTAMAYVMGVFLLGLPLNAIPRLATGLQLGWMVGMWTALGGVLSLALVVAATTLRLPFTHFLLLGMLPPVLVNLGLAAALFWRLGWPFRSDWFFDWSITLPLIRQGGLFLVPQINTLIVGAAPQVLISTVLGAAAVTPYNLVQRLLNIFNQGLIMFIQPMWPAFAEAQSRRDWGWVAGAFQKAFAVTALVALAFCLCFCVGAPPFIKWWSHTPGSNPSLALVYSFSLLTLVTALGQPGFCLLGACNRLTGFSIYATATSVVFLACAVPAIKAHGPVGMIILLTITYTIFSLGGSLTEIAYWQPRFMAFSKLRLSFAKRAPVVSSLLLLLYMR